MGQLPQSSPRGIISEVFNISCSAAVILGRNIDERLEISKLFRNRNAETRREPAYEDHNPVGRFVASDFTDIKK